MNTTEKVAILANSLEEYESCLNRYFDEGGSKASITYHIYFPDQLNTLDDSYVVIDGRDMSVKCQELGLEPDII